MVPLDGRADPVRISEFNLGHVCTHFRGKKKLSFFLTVAKQLNTFLTTYQTDKPMLAFLSGDMERILRGLMERFMKQDTMKTTKSLVKLTKLDVKDKKLHCDYKKTDVGFAATKTLKELIAAKEISDRQLMEFRMEAIDFLVRVTAKLLDKAPIKYSLVRNMSCLDPREMARNPADAVHKMSRILENLVAARRIKENVCDDVLQQLREFLTVTVSENMAQFSEFDPFCTTHRLDVLLHEHMADKPAYRSLWKVVSMLLLLSHGQASVERGFSVNQQVDVENLQEQSFVAQRMVCDHLRSVGGIGNVTLNKKLLVSAASARSRYHAYLDEQREKKATEVAKLKRKAAADVLEELKKKKTRIQKDAEAMEMSADSYADKAEATGNLTFIAKSNSLRKSSKEKKEAAAALDREIDEQLQLMKTT